MSRMPDTLDCPHCGHGHRLDESDTYGAITSYWGDGDPHDFSCEQCEADFVVKETVTREWEPFKTAEEARA